MLRMTRDAPDVPVHGQLLFITGLNRTGLGQALDNLDCSVELSVYEPTRIHSLNAGSRFRLVGQTETRRSRQAAADLGRYSQDQCNYVIRSHGQKRLHTLESRYWRGVVNRQLTCRSWRGRRDAFSPQVLQPARYSYFLIAH